jgi:uncharacterized membrane protein (DUF485 family)
MPALYDMNGLANQSNPATRRHVMEPAAYAKIRRNPKFAELVQQRNALARNLTIAMFVFYFGFILLVAFGKGFLGTPLSEGSVTTIGIPVGIFVIVSAFILTGIYVAKANTTFDNLNNQILEESK